MEYIQSIILGIIEGLTEFLPISSTFHLIWATKILGVSQSEFQKLFEVVIQAGAILAVSLLYFRNLLSHPQRIKLVSVSFLPTALIGFILYKLIKGIFFENFPLQLIVFAAVGVVFIIFERYYKKQYKKTASQIGYKEAFFVGLIQSLAVIPGVSRAGAVMLGMMYLGVKREEAAEYSFLLAIPTIFAAAFFDLLKMREVLVSQSGNIVYLLLGTLVSFISALFVIKWFIRFLQNHTLELFGWYRLVVVLLLLLFRI